MINIMKNLEVITYLTLMIPALSFPKDFS